MVSVNQTFFSDEVISGDKIAAVTALNTDSSYRQRFTVELTVGGTVRKSYNVISEQGTGSVTVMQRTEITGSGTRTLGIQIPETGYSTTSSCSIVSSYSDGVYISSVDTESILLDNETLTITYDVTNDTASDATVPEKNILGRVVDGTPRADKQLSAGTRSYTINANTTVTKTQTYDISNVPQSVGAVGWIIGIPTARHPLAASDTTVVSGTSGMAITGVTAPDTVSGGSALNVDVDVGNTSAVTSGTVEMRVNGQIRDNKSITVPENEIQTISLSDTIDQSETLGLATPVTVDTTDEQETVYTDIKATLHDKYQQSDTTRNQALPQVPAIGHPDASSYADVWGELLNSYLVQALDETETVTDTIDTLDTYAPYSGALFIPTDAPVMYRGTGSSWVRVGTDGRARAYMDQGTYTVSISSSGTYNPVQATVAGNTDNSFEVASGANIKHHGLTYTNEHTPADATITATITTSTEAEVSLFKNQLQMSMTAQTTDGVQQVTLHENTTLQDKDTIGLGVKNPTDTDDIDIEHFSILCQL
jgi:hypothetical protein